MNALTLILGLILPPAAIAMHKGVSTAFGLNVLLTGLGFVPGVIHALWTVSQTDEELPTPQLAEAVRLNITQVII